MTKKKIEGRVVKIVNWNNYKITRGEVFTNPSMTVPDESYTIQEILEKYSRGINLNIERQGEYDNSDDFDIIDQRQLVKDYADIPEVVYLQNEIKKEKLSKRKGKDENAKLTKEVEQPESVPEAKA